MISNYTSSILEIFGAHPYILIFIGLIFAGETILLPALYLAFAGKLSLLFVLLTAFAATIISDYAWYLVGAYMETKFSQRLISGRIRKAFIKLSGVFEKRALRVLFLSKFVYGTRVVSHILAGAKRLSLKTYFTVNFLSTSLLFAFITLLVYSVGMTVSSIQGLVHDVEIALLIIVALVVSAHIIFGIFIKKTWFQ
jgi:membrane protein DedA with SNARE-associated domain